jgi:hypothetical protein
VMFYQHPLSVNEIEVQARNAVFSFTDCYNHTSVSILKPSNPRGR